MILSFHKTTAAVEARRKSVTRREWSDVYHERIVRRLKEALNAGMRGLEMQAWSASPHHKGHRIGTVLITSVTKEPTRKIPDSDWEAEGFAFMAENGINVAADLTCERLWRLWRMDRAKVTSVVRFEIVSLVCEEAKC